jgi:flagellar basal-body rod protein FlgB
MATPIEPVTTAALSAALDAAVRRHAVTAVNISNTGTEAYQPLRLSLDAGLEEARAHLAQSAFLDRRGLDALRELSTAPARPQEGSVQLDAEMTELARNAVHFQALLQGLSRHLSLLALAAGDGRK